jgi:MFS family permease
LTYRALLAHRDARSYLVAQSFSALGDSAMWLACAIWVKSLTGSSGAAGLTFFFYLLASLGAPASGLVADKLPRRRLLTLLNSVGALVLVPLLFVRDAGDVWIIYAVMTAYGAIAVMIGPAQSGLLTTLLPADLLGSANGLLRGIQESLRLLAPVVGAGVYAVAGPTVVVAIDAATFLVAAVVLLSMRGPDPSPSPTESGLGQRLLAGVAFVRGHGALRRTTLGSANRFDGPLSPRAWTGHRSSSGLFSSSWGLAQSSGASSPGRS